MTLLSETPSLDNEYEWTYNLKFKYIINYRTGTRRPMENFEF